MSEARKQFEAWLSRYGVTMESQWIEKRCDDLMKEKPTPNNWSRVHWCVTIKRGVRAMSLQFSSGGHDAIQYAIKNASKAPWNLKSAAANFKGANDKTPTEYVASFFRKRFNADSNPWRAQQSFAQWAAHKMGADPYDVFSCIASDSQCYENSESFEQWASELGYGADSISALRIYEACKAQHYAAEFLFGRSALHELQSIQF